MHNSHEAGCCRQEHWCTCPADTSGQPDERARAALCHVAHVPQHSNDVRLKFVQERLQGPYRHWNGHKESRQLGRVLPAGTQCPLEVPLWGGMPCQLQDVPFPLASRQLLPLDTSKTWVPMSMQRHCVCTCASLSRSFTACMDALALRCRTSGAELVAAHACTSNPSVHKPLPASPLAGLRVLWLLATEL